MLKMTLAKLIRIIIPINAYLQQKLKLELHFHRSYPCLQLGGGEGGLDRDVLVLVVHKGRQGRPGLRFPTRRFLYLNGVR